ncbi:hypothetical protein AB0K27_11085 [Micromonospora echinospora]|uniref:Uncharacterized protein n=1 Tax=Micromonospora echinospora TaxID=1877 RepID=A0ABR6MIC9_MICEC|nr:hypothetical protein [Micromonospora echinospora]MBB5115125.1 hypothetical protein [Micromonospora echinospora]
MTSAPANLLAVRNLLLTYLNVDKKAVRGDDLEPAEVGIVGDVNHRGGYHCGSDRVVRNDYSVVESSRDRNGLTLHASGLDVGTFSVRSGGGTHNLRTFSAWMVAQCAANAADTRDIREIIYSPDGRTVRRWDRLGRRTGGDSSHLFHTHFSFFRDSTKAGRDQTPLFRRYLTAIGMIAIAKPEDDMEQSDRLIKDTGSRNRTVGDVLADLQNLRNWLISPANTTGLVNPPMPNSPLQQMLAMLRAWPALVAQVNELSGKDFTDEQQIVSGVLAGLPPEKIAEAIPPQIARDVADELSRRLTA